MREGKFLAREKKTQKMTRDGLVEKSALSKEERRISSRTADFSLDKKKLRPKTQASKGESPKGKKQKQRDFSGNLHKETISPYEALEQEVAADAEDKAAQEEEILPQKGEIFKQSNQKGKAARKGTSFCRSSADTGRFSFREKKQSSDRTKETESRGTTEHRPYSTGKAKKQKAHRTFQFERKEQTKEERTAAHSESTADSCQKQKVCKAEEKAEKAAQKLDDAKENLPKRTRFTFEREFDAEHGKAKRRLSLKTEEKPEAQTSLKGVVATTLLSAPVSSLWQKGHQKIHQVEEDNVGVESAHRMEKRAEQLGALSYHHHQYQKKHQPYRMVRKLERKVQKANCDVAYQRALLEHPELEQKSFAKWIQKQRIKKEYAKAARKAENTVQTVQSAKQVFVQVIRAIAHFCGVHKVVLGTVAVGCALFVMMASLLGSCAAFFSGAGTSTFAASYTADDQDINSAQLYYTEKETDLQYKINHIEEEYPGFQEYRYKLGKIGHDAYELMAYLSAMYDFFTFAEIEPILDALFQKQYDLQLIEQTEIREDSDGNEYEWRILNVILTVTPMEQITIPEMTAAGTKYKYDVYQQTYGNRQNYGNPFSFCWLSYVSSPYGYRLNPFTGEKELHNGIDIAVSAGTPIHAVHDGKVVLAGDAGDYGLCVVIEDERGYQSRYAHCQSLSVTAGQEIKKGEEIAAVGSTGNSTGPHLHLEVSYQGQRLNPFYFVDNGYETKEETNE